MQNSSGGLRPKFELRSKKFRPLLWANLNQRKLFFSGRRESGLRPSRRRALGPLNAGVAWIQRGEPLIGLRYI